MTAIPRTAAQRRIAAQEALAAIRTRLGDHRRLQVRCGRSHHVADVYDADGVPIFVATVGVRAHGRRDRVDTAHHANKHGQTFTDLLGSGDPAVDGPEMGDELPASCECGPHTLSRRAVVEALRSGDRELILA